MEVQLVRLSRPLLVATDKLKDGSFLYKTVYGFRIQDWAVPAEPGEVKPYVGYLAGLHDWSNGGSLFTVSYERRGVPDWKDKRGVIHISQDAWMNRIGQQCIDKYNLSFDSLIMDIDDEDIKTYFNEDDLLVDEHFYYELKGNLDGKGVPSSFDSGDELPF